MRSSPTRSDSSAQAAVVSTGRNGMRRVLIHGFGSIGQRHLRVIRSLEPMAELAVLSEHGQLPDTAQTPAHRFSQLADALRFQPEAVVVANAAVAHPAAAATWLQAGAHVLVEKPLAASAEGLQTLDDIVRASGRVLQVGYNLRQASGLRQMRAYGSQDRMGRVHSARVEVGQHLASWRPGAAPLRSVSAQRALGGGVLLELSHEIDYLQWLLGPVAWVSAHLLRQGTWNIDVEDTALLTLGFAGPDGCVASLQMDFVRHDSTRRCTLMGEHGSLRWDALNGSVQYMAAGKADWETLEQSAPERDATYCAQWRAFVAACQGTAPPAVSLADGARVLRVVDAARHSADRGGQRTDVEPWT